MSNAVLQQTEDDYPPLRALNDLLYCERRCALHRLENVWVDNTHTMQGTYGHERADRPVDWKRGDGREVHGMWVKSDRLKIVGKADVVEFQPAAATGDRGMLIPRVACTSGSYLGLGGLTSPRSPDNTGNEIPYPVEYKRGKRRKWDNDDVQLCAQALCLEEMLGMAVPRGAIFHIQTKRRREVQFTVKLRQKTEQAIARLHELIHSGVTPPAVLKPQCEGCSLHGLCLPEAMSRTTEVSRYVESLFQATS